MAKSRHTWRHSSADHAPPAAHRSDSAAESSERKAESGWQELVSQGVFLFYREQEGDAVEYLKQALARQPNDLRARYLICLAAQLHGDEPVIEKACEEAKAIDPKDPYTQACDAVRFMNYANHARADELFERALLELPSDVDLWFGRGLLYDYSGDRDKAVGAYLRVLHLDPNNVSARIGLGNAYAQGGELERAYEEYTRAKQLDPETDNPHNRLGRDLLYGSDPPGAVIEFQQAIEEEPNCLSAYFFLFATQRYLGKTDEMLETYQQIRARFNDQPDETGGFFEQFGAWDDAIRDYRRALAENPNDAGTHERLAESYKGLGSWDQAAEEYRAVIRLQPRNGHAHEELGNTLFWGGDYDGAIKACRTAIELERYPFTAYRVLADCLLLKGDAAGAGELSAQHERLQEQAHQEYQRKYYGD